MVTNCSHSVPVSLSSPLFTKLHKAFVWVLVSSVVKPVNKAWPDGPCLTRRAATHPWEVLLVLLQLLPRAVVQWGSWQ